MTMTTTLTRPETEYSQTTGGRSCDGCPRCQDANAGFCKQIHNPEYGEPPPGMPQLRPLCPPGPAQRRHIRPRAGSTPGLNSDEPQLLCRTRKRKSLCGPSTNGIPVGRESRNTMWTDYQRHRQSHNSRGSSRVFYRWHRLFSAPRRFFMPALRRKSFRPFIDPLYM